ncbi:MAG: selenide, water dikinase SelD [Candidatus Krumholzibacteriales bacterium]
MRLTRFTHGLGCACKLRPQALEQILRDLPVPSDPNIIVGTETMDDATVYRINRDTAVVQTLDFFTPVVDDPYSFGAIAAANSFSDIYAMGAAPIFALNIAGFPSNRLPLEVLRSILEGAREKAAEAGVSILGGHTVDDTEPKFGLAVTGLVHPDRVLTNSGLKEGDALILTKPLGTGILSTALKRGLLERDREKELISVMSELNRTAAETAAGFEVSACTDVTGFGLLGHLSEMIGKGDLMAVISAGKVPVMEGVRELAAAGAVPGGTLSNLDYISGLIEWGGKISRTDRIVLCDAQTSGGLLISLPAEKAEELKARLEEAGLSAAAVIGEIISGDGRIKVTKG